MRYHNIKNSEIKMVRGLKTLVIEWDDGDRDEIWGSCLHSLRFNFMMEDLKEKSEIEKVKVKLDAIRYGKDRS